MGQLLNRLKEAEGIKEVSKSTENTTLAKPANKDLSDLPPELSLGILSYLNVTDLCIASCVWQELAADEVLWHDLCVEAWPYSSIYKHSDEPGFSWRRVYLRLDEAVVTFNHNAVDGIKYLINHGLIEDDSPEEVARFLHKAKFIYWKQKRDYIRSRREVLDHIVTLQNFENEFLPNALRNFFEQVNAPNDRGSFLHFMIERFSERFCTCNPNLGLSNDTIYVICFSLILLSVDLASPHVKNKMSKREFIRNTRRATQGINDDFAGHLYDNIYLVGHVAPKA